MSSLFSVSRKEDIPSSFKSPLNGSQNVDISKNRNRKRPYCDGDKESAIYVRKGSINDKKSSSLSSDEDDENTEIEIPLLKQQKKSVTSKELVANKTTSDSNVHVIRDRLNKSSGYVSNPS